MGLLSHFVVPVQGTPNRSAFFYPSKYIKRRSNAISSDDPQALEKLQAKLEACENKQQSMKEINKYFRKNGTCVGYPGMTEATARKLDESIKRAYSWEKQPFPSYELTNNNAEIRRLKQRIDLLTQQKETGFVG